MAVGTLLAATAVSCYILHKRHRRKKSNSDNKHDNLPSSTTDDPTDDTNSNVDNNDNNNFYKQMGIAEDNLPTHIQREIYKERQRKKKEEMISMKSPMYDNIYMLDQQGEVLCTISNKKANWYIRKGIGKWSSFKKKDNNINNNNNCKEGEEEVKCIQLLFEHNRTNKKGSSEEVYLTSAKQNICVACGSDGYHIRHYIVPYSYRTMLPKEYKSHMSHDIVILCPTCHVDCEGYSKRRMKDMESELRLKLGPEYNVSPVIEDSHLANIRSCAIALAKWKDKMPREKVDRYDTVIREYLASICTNEEETNDILNTKKELTKSQLQAACGVKYRVKNPNYVPGANIVVQSLQDDKAIEQFILDWRNHFLDTVQPRFMPNGWRVDNPVACGTRSDWDEDDEKLGVKSWFGNTAFL